MTLNNSIAPAEPGYVFQRLMLGIIIGLILISNFLFSAEYIDSSWGNLNLVRPLIIVPIAGALGVLFFHLINLSASRAAGQNL